MKKLFFAIAAAGCLMIAPQISAHKGPSSTKIATTQILTAGDTVSFGPLGAWKGPVMKDGCATYTVVGELGLVYVKHKDGTEHRFPGGKQLAGFATGQVVYICDRTLYLPARK